MIVIKFSRTFDNVEFQEVIDLLEALSFYGDISVLIEEKKNDSDT